MSNNRLSQKLKLLGYDISMILYYSKTMCNGFLIQHPPHHFLFLPPTHSTLIQLLSSPMVFIQHPTPPLFLLYSYLNFYFYDYIKIQLSIKIKLKLYDTNHRLKLKLNLSIKIKLNFRLER